MGSRPIRQDDEDDASDDEILLVAPPHPAPPLSTTSASDARTPAASSQSSKRPQAAPNDPATSAKAPRRSEPYLSLPSNNNSSSHKWTEDASKRSAKRRKTLADLPTTSSGLLSAGALDAVTAVLTPPVSKSYGPTSSRSPAPVRQHTRWTDDASGSSSKRISYYSPPPFTRAPPPASLIEPSNKPDAIAAERPPSSAPPSKRKRTRSPTFDLTITRSPPSKSGSDSPPSRGAKGKQVEAHLPSPTSLPSPPLPTAATAAIAPDVSKVDDLAKAVVPDSGRQPTSRRKASNRSPPRSTTFELVIPMHARPARRSVTPRSQAGSTEANAEGSSCGAVLTKAPPPPLPFPNKPAQHPLNSLRLRPPTAPPALPRFWRNDDFPPARDLGEWIAPCVVLAKGKGRTTMTSSRSREETPVSAAVTAAFSAAVASDVGGGTLTAAACVAISTDANAVASTSRLPTPALPPAKPAVKAPPSFKAWMKQRYEFLEPYETSRYKIDGSTLGLDPDPLSYEWDEDELWSDYEERYGWEERDRVARGEEEEEEAPESDEDERMQQDSDSRDAELPPPRPKMACTVGEDSDVMVGTEFISRLCSAAMGHDPAADSAEALAAADHLNRLTQSRGLVQQFPWRWRSLDEGKGRASNKATKWATRNPYMRGKPDPYEHADGRRATRRARKALGEPARQAPAQRAADARRVSPSLSVASDSTTTAGSSTGIGRASVDASTSRTVSPELYAIDAPAKALPPTSVGASVESVQSSTSTFGPPFDPFRPLSTFSLPASSLPAAPGLVAKLASVPASDVQPTPQPLRSPASVAEEPPLVRTDLASGTWSEAAADASGSAPIPTLVLSDDSSSETAEVEKLDPLPFGARADSAGSDDPIALLAGGAPESQFERSVAQDGSTPRRSRKLGPLPTYSSDESDDAARVDDGEDDASSEASEESGYPTVVGGSSRASSPALAGTASSDASSPAPSMSSSPRIFQRLAAPPTVQRAKPRLSVPVLQKSARSPKPRSPQKSAATPSQRGRVSPHSTPPENVRCNFASCPSPFYKPRAKSTLRTHEKNYHYPTSALHYTMPKRTVVIKRDAKTHAFQCPFCPHWSLNSASFSQHVDRAPCSGVKP